MLSFAAVISNIVCIIQKKMIFLKIRIGWNSTPLTVLRFKFLKASKV